MKHVNDEFWQKFSPAVLQYAKDVGKPDFFMFGEVADGTRPLTSHYTTHNQVQSVLDFPFQEAARAWVSKSGASKALGDFFVDDGYYTDADSNAYQLPTFLGNHDAGHIGMFLRDDNPAGTSEDELLQRDKLAHGLMYSPAATRSSTSATSRATRAPATTRPRARTCSRASTSSTTIRATTRLQRQHRLALHAVNSYNAEGNFWTGHPLYREIAQLARLAKDIRRCATAPSSIAIRTKARRLRLQPDPRRRPARVRRRAQQRRDGQDGHDPDLDDLGELRPDLRREHGHLAQRHRRRLTVTVPPLSAVVYRARGTVPASAEAPRIFCDLAGQAQRRGRRAHGGRRGGERLLRPGVPNSATTPREPKGKNDKNPTASSPSSHEFEPGTSVLLRAVVLDNAGHTRASAARSAQVGEPRVSIAVAPRARTEIRVTTNPELSHYVVTVQRKVGDGPWTVIGSDDSSPVYTVTDTPTDGAVYRAVLDYGSGTVTSAEASAPPPAIVHYRRPAGDYLDWGVHVWGEAAAQPTDWTAPLQRTGADCVRRGLRGADRGPGQAVELHRPPPERGQRAHHPRAGREPLLRARRAQRDLAHAGRPGGLLHAATGMS